MKGTTLPSITIEIATDLLTSAKEVLRVDTDSEAVNLAIREVLARERNRVDMDATLDRPARQIDGLKDLFARTSVFDESHESAL